MFAQLLTTQRSLKYFYVFKLLKQFCNSQIKINFEQMPALAFAFAFEKAVLYKITSTKPLRLASIFEEGFC